MTDQLLTNLKKSYVVPLVQAEEPDEAVSVSRALVEGGLEVLEVVCALIPHSNALKRFLQRFLT